MTQYGILMFQINMDIKSINLESSKQKITAKQAEFARLIAEEHLTSSDAYRQACVPKSSVKNKSIHEMACRVLTNVKDQSMIMTIQCKRAEQNRMMSQRREEYVLKKLIEEIEHGSKASSRIRALELLGKTISMFSDKLEMHSTQTERTSNEVTAELEIKLQTLLND